MPMPRPSLPELAGRVPQRLRRKVPMGLRNRIVERLGHPVEPFDPHRFPRRVNVGCGFDVREGWLNVDFQDFHSPDLVSDVRALPALPSGFYDEMLAQDILEHLPRADAQVALKEWHRVLREGGRLHLRVPDLGAILRWLGEEESVEHHRRVIHHLMGTQAYEGDFHLNTFTDVVLCEELFDAGFGDAVLEQRDGWLWEADAVKGAPRRALAFNGGFQMAREDGWRALDARGELLVLGGAAVRLEAEGTLRVDGEARESPVEIPAAGAVRRLVLEGPAHVRGELV